MIDILYTVYTTSVVTNAQYYIKLLQNNGAKDCSLIELYYRTIDSSIDRAKENSKGFKVIMVILVILLCWLPRTKKVILEVKRGHFAQGGVS